MGRGPIRFIFAAEWRRVALHLIAGALMALAAVACTVSDGPHWPYDPDPDATVGAPDTPLPGDVYESPGDTAHTDRSAPLSDADSGAPDEVTHSPEMDTVEGEVDSSGDTGEPGDTDEPGDTATPDPDTGTPSDCDDCDDNILCTISECLDEVCTHTPISPNSSAILYRPAPVFALQDVNPHSATSGQTLSLTGDLSGKVVFLMFHEASCLPCREMGQGARALVADYAGDSEIFFATINSVSAAGSVDDYINFYETHDTEDRELPDYEGPSTWALLQDTAGDPTWSSYCAENYRVIILDGWGVVQYSRIANLKDSPFRDELVVAIEKARAAQPPGD